MKGFLEKGIKIHLKSSSSHGLAEAGKGFQAERMFLASSVEVGKACGIKTVLNTAADMPRKVDHSTNVYCVQ